jgi:dipeptidyl aminopeptidase/acylaminoacyl peptidase
MRTTTVAIAFMVTVFSYGQHEKKIIDHTVYDEWNTIKSTQVSERGKIVTYEINPHRGDGSLSIHLPKVDQITVVSRGKNALISQNEKVVVFFIDPGFDTLRQLELEKVKKDKWITDSLGVLLVDQDSLIIIPAIKQVKLAKTANLLVYLRHENRQPPPVISRKWFRKVEQPITIDSEGKELVVWNYQTGDTLRRSHVTDYTISENGKWLFFVTQKKENKKEIVSACLLNTETGEQSCEASFTEIAKYAFNHKQQELAFVASADTSKQKTYALYLWKHDQAAPALVVDTNHSNRVVGMDVGNSFTPRFSKNDDRLFFGFRMIPEKEQKDTLLEKEKAKLDLWHHQDKQLQPQQLLGKKRTLERNFLAVLNLNNRQLMTIENDTMYAHLPKEFDSDFILLSSKERYEKSYTWEYPWPRDFYRYHLNDAELVQTGEEQAYAQGLSPSGRFFVWFDLSDGNYKVKDLLENDVYCMTCRTPYTVEWQTDNNGQPHDPSPFGVAGYTTNERSLLIHSKYDIWEYDLETKGMMPLTNKLGEMFNTELRVLNRDTDSVYVDKNRMLIHGTDLNTKDERVYSLVESIRKNALTQLLDTQHKLVGIQFSPAADAVIYQKMNVIDYPDVYWNTVDFDREKKLSLANPQQADYIWPTVEMIRWNSYSGKELEGLVYKPENFDPNKSYPLLVYFYELYGDRKHNHYIPKPTASIIFASEYASAGYVVFIPDIRYDPGYPARGAYDCIMSGTDEVLRLNKNIDSTRMGLQGQSWGGYQTAQLITMTNRYKAAMAGAPVSNMFSAYGGIRWGSGFNRQFQYERTQSRIGKTIWEAPELYVENSPLFHLPKVQTPLLIMHNDKDGAVPWYQGIELFVGLRRLNKPVWMLNYNGDDHNLMQDANRRDLSVRMRQFFDYYLQGAPAPRWLIDGIPATEKGKDYRLD